MALRLKWSRSELAKVSVVKCFSIWFASSGGRHRHLILGQKQGLGPILENFDRFLSTSSSKGAISVPTRQTALAAPGDLSHLLCRVVGTPQGDGQKASPRRTILALRMRVAQSLDLLLRQLRLLFGHVPIIQHLDSLSIRLLSVASLVGLEPS
jgi:hypothetical protein